MAVRYLPAKYPLLSLPAVTPLIEISSPSTQNGASFQPPCQSH